MRATPARGPLTRWFIGVNIAMFLAQAVLLFWVRSDLPRFLWLEPVATVWGLQIWRTVTHMFCHSPTDILHIAFNMLFLWWFGRDIEGLYGTRRFGAFYFAAGIFAALCYCAVSLILGDDTPALGASGAIMGVVVLAALHWPHRPIIFIIIPMRLYQLALIIVFIDLYYSMFLIEYSTVANVAHLGGALFGFLFYHNWPRAEAWLAAQERARKRLSIRRDSELEQRIDQILEKIHQEGLGSLTRKERQILNEASHRRGDPEPD